ncbi:hypothetical protein C8Q76DRAFT_586439, partial [Earliella scabrosa]
ILRACGGVISGSVALQYFLPDEQWIPGDMDVYLPDRMFDTFLSVIVRDPRIQFVPIPNSLPPRKRSSERGVNGIKDVVRFQTKDRREVDVIRSAANNPCLPLTSFWSTLLINFLTPDGCVCGFPSPTFVRTGALK